MPDDKTIDRTKEDYEGLYAFAFRELKSDLQEMKSEVKELRTELVTDIKNLRKDIFGNGNPGMCTKRQDILKTWVLKELGLLSKEIMSISNMPSKVYNIVWKVLAMMGMLGTGLAFLMKYFELK